MIVVLADVPLAPSTVAEFCSVVAGVITDGAVEVLECELTAAAAPDLTVIDALARMQLAARRAGGRIVLRTRDRDVAGLLALTGLDEVVPSALEPDR